MPFINAEDIKIFYREFGKGDPLIFIAGAGMDSRGWQFQVNDFSKNYRVVVFDNRGSGRSDAPECPYSVSMMTHDTKRLLDTLNIENANGFNSAIMNFLGDL